jgi:hypothetical protein
MGMPNPSPCDILTKMSKEFGIELEIKDA